MLQQLDLVENKNTDAPFQMTKEEIEKFQKAFQNKEFRDLFQNYVDEISNPDSRKLYEKEIQQLEEERGNSIRWIKPTENWVVQTKGTPSPLTKTPNVFDGKFSGIVYINFVSSVEIQVPTSKPSKKGSKLGVTWSLPHSLTSPRPDLGLNGEIVEIYDVVYHPDAYIDPKMKDILIDTGIASIQEKFKTKISKEFTILQDIKYKGTPINTVIRSPLNSNSIPNPQTSSDPSSTPFLKSAPPSSSPAPIPSIPPPITSEKKTFKMEQPKHEFLYQHTVELSEFTNQREMSRGTDPLLLRFFLPKVQHAADIDIQLTESQCVLHVPEMYYSVLELPKKVDPDKIKAKWISDKKVLEIVCLLVTTSISKSDHLGS